MTSGTPEPEASVPAAPVPEEPVPAVPVPEKPVPAVSAPAVGRWDDAMRLALDVAASLPVAEVPVGAVVIAPDGTVLATEGNLRETRTDPTAHAEVLALQAAAARLGSWRLTGCTLVVTLEPCPMCAGALVLARVERLVYGASDPKAGAVGSQWDLVRDRRLNWRPEVVSGVLEQEAGQLLRSFFSGRRPVR